MVAAPEPQALQLQQPYAPYQAVRDKDILSSESSTVCSVGAEVSGTRQRKLRCGAALGLMGIAAMLALGAVVLRRCLASSEPVAKGLRSPASLYDAAYDAQAYAQDPYAGYTGYEAGYEAGYATAPAAPAVVAQDASIAYYGPEDAVAAQAAAYWTAQAAAPPAAPPAVAMTMPLVPMAPARAAQVDIAAQAIDEAAGAPGGAAAAAAAPVGPCVAAGDDCRASQCCTEPGFQCFRKNADYGTCRALCVADETWECAPLGEPALIPEGPEHCAWSGDNCVGKKCCNDANMKCFQKDAYFAGCKFELVEGWDNTVLGEFRGWSQNIGAGPEGVPTMGTKLYCIAVQSPNNRVEEDKLVNSAREKGLGIFSCDENSIFMGAPAAQTAWKSISNTDIFINIWNQVQGEGKYSRNDWTIKADPDCVFFGNRIKMHLGKLNVPQDEAVYLKNCDFKFRFQGSLEIFSKKAMEKYYKYAGMCADKIGHEGGEDFFIMTCMDAMGVKNIEDDSILYDKYATGEHLILDDVSACKNGWTAAFHPFRTLDVWNHCAEVSVIAEQQYAADHPGA